MIYSPKSEIKQLVFIILISLALGLIIDAVAWTLVLALSGYILWNLRQLFRLHEWIKDSRPVDPPASHGLWGAVFDDIYELQRKQFKYRARLKKVIKRFRDSTYALRDGFVMINKYGNLDWWNPAAERLLGLRSPIDKNQLVTNLIRDPRFKTYFYKKNHEEPLTLTSPVNPACELEFQITVFGKRDSLMIVRDITQAKNMERVRTDFVANVSHELRTPLTVFDGYMETLSNNKEFSDPRLQQALQHMTQQCKRMKLLIDDLMYLSRLETKPSYLNKPVNIDVLTKRVLSDLRPRLDNRKNKVTTDIDPELLVLGQEEDLYSMLSNLVTNASKYSQEGCHIQLRWKEQGNGGVLSVQDNGAGIDATDLPRLTERFYRADKTRSQTIVGTGLGLSIVKHILIRHDAKLDIQSKPGVGSSFECIFPEHRVKSKKTAIKKKRKAS